ncbi:MAG: ferritin-like domain-containing protein [Gemmatimonas sp.]
MPQSDTLHDLFVDELKDAYDHEKQLVKALRKMAKAATHPDLANAFSSHLDETNGQIATLEEVFGMIDMKPKGKHCAGIAGIIEEGNEAIEEHDKSPLLDAALVGGGKRAEHYEIAAYTTLIAMAKELGIDEAAASLDEILQQEIACDQKLDSLGEMLLPMANQNEDADRNGNSDDDESNANASPTTARAPGKNVGSAKSPARKSPVKKAAGKTAGRR